MKPDDIIAVYVARVGNGWGLVAVLRDGRRASHHRVYQTLEQAMLACIRASMVSVGDFGIQEL